MTGGGGGRRRRTPSPPIGKGVTPTLLASPFLSSFFLHVYTTGVLDFVELHSQQKYFSLERYSYFFSPLINV
jgi:hypothetical protein